MENYSDRNHATDLGIYRQTVAEQFYPYIRPQETGTKTDIRWWRQLNEAGSGLQFVAEAPFSASALNYTIESLDDGLNKDQRHSPEVIPVDYTNPVSYTHLGQLFLSVRNHPSERQKYAVDFER